jgi:hypothetical protein
LLAGVFTFLKEINEEFHFVKRKIIWDVLFFRRKDDERHLLRQVQVLKKIHSFYSLWNLFRFENELVYRI